MRYAAKVDTNQAEIVEALRAAGCTVCLMHTVGQGFPDLLVSKRGYMWLIEVKGPKGRLTKREEEWIRNWDAPVWIVRSVEQALELVGAVEYKIKQTEKETK